MTTLPNSQHVAYAINYSYPYLCPTIYLWDMNLDSTTEFTGGSALFSASRSPIEWMASSGDLLVAAGGDEPPLVWSLSQRKIVGRLECPLNEEDGFAEPVAVSDTYRLAEPPVKREPVRIHAA